MENVSGKDYDTIEITAVPYLLESIPITSKIKEIEEYTNWRNFDSYIPPKLKTCYLKNPFSSKTSYVKNPEKQNLDFRKIFSKKILT